MCTNKIICGDAQKLINQLSDNSIDLIVTSVPYNSGLEYDSYDDSKDDKEYYQMLKTVFSKAYQKLKPGGRCCINIGDRENGKIPTHVEIVNLMQKIGYLMMTTIIWDKENASNRLSWGSFKSPKNPSFPTPFEYILVFSKESYALQETGETDLTNQEFVNWSLAKWLLRKTDYKRCTRLINSGIHKAPFPEEIPRRLIKMLSWKSATVLDPFVGTGTTAIAAKRLGRNYIGFDLSQKNVDYAIKNLQNLMVETTLFEEE